MEEDTRNNQARPSSPPHNPGLIRLVEGKKAWRRRLDPESRKRGFLGWHERGYLPHLDLPRVTQFVTFMLDDSFPVTRNAEWEPILHEPDAVERRKKLEAWLDRSHGACWLQRPAVAEGVERIIRAEDGQRYKLRAWVIMPNHVHLVVDVWEKPLTQLLQTWKGRSARESNLHLGRSGRFWEREYFDTLISDQDHLRRAIRYTEGNSVKAGFVPVPRDWPWSSARYRDAYERLPSEQTEAD